MTEPTIFLNSAQGGSIMPAVSVQNLDKYEMVGGVDGEMARAEVSVKVNLLKMFRDVCPAEDIWVAYKSVWAYCMQNMNVSNVQVMITLCSYHHR